MALLMIMFVLVGASISISGISEKSFTLELNNFEQLTPALLNVNQVNWSPYGNFIVFVSGSNIYIVNTIK